MAKTFEALMKAEKEKKIRLEETKVFDQKPPITSLSRETVSVPSQTTEEYHRLKHHIKTIAQEEAIRTIVFASATHEEGTSTVLVNFAITLAKECNTVLLIDANLRTPSLHQYFNLEQKVGLSGLLQGKATLENVIKQTKIANLSVITSGSPQANPFSLFESESLDGLIEQMKEHAYWVLFDSPPVNHYNEGILLGARVDGVVMVVEAEETRWEVAQSGRERLENGRAKILGAVLNRRKMYIPGWVYRML